MKALQPPSLRDGLIFYLQAFSDLDSERHHGESWMKIPWSSILLYAQFYELEGEQVDRFLSIIMAMDVAHLAELEKRRIEKEATNKGRKSG